jgi:hypothetical protein
LPSRSWTGKTEVIPKQAVMRGARSVGELLCAVPNDKLELLPGINVNVKINAKERLNVLSVPREAVQVEGGSRYVYVVRDGQVGLSRTSLEKRQVQLGVADAINYEVVSGLKQEEMVALPRDVELRDGMAVQIVNTDSSGRGGT